ncbi:hypothetical protein MTO96_045173 [Rhipicephalus appendiculatus]
MLVYLLRVGWTSGYCLIRVLGILQVVDEGSDCTGVPPTVVPNLRFARDGMLTFDNERTGLGSKAFIILK